MNHVNGLVSFLKGVSAVTALVGSPVRVFGPDGVPAAQNASMPREAIVLSPAGGARAASYQEFGERRVDVLCFGPNQAQSYVLYLAVFAALKQLRRSRVSVAANSYVLLHWAHCSAEGVTAREPETGWPATLSSWQVLASEIAA